MKQIKHFVNTVKGEPVYLVYIELDNGEEIKASFDNDGNIIFVDDDVWEEVGL